MSDCVMSWHAGSGKWAGGSNAAVPHTGLSQPVYSNSGGLHADHNCSPRQTGHGQSFSTLAALGIIAWYTTYCSNVIIADGLRQWPNIHIGAMQNA